MKIFSPAKINLFLNIVGKFDDGYHDIRSVISRVDLYDEIFIEESEKLNISFTGEFSSMIQNNNILNLFLFLADHKMIKKNFFSIKINKNIPVGAGLGGGSSNIASVLNYLEDKKFISSNDKITISRKLGSDIEFFLNDGHALIAGKGEVKSRGNKTEELHTVIVYPKIALQTYQVYKSVRSYDDGQINTFINLNQTSLLEILEKNKNFLESAAVMICPEIKKITEILKLYPKCLFPRMTGSGSSCFGVFKEKKDAEYVENDLKIKHPDWWTCSAKII